MDAVIILILLTGLPDPSAAVIAVNETPKGLLYTDGCHAGLYLYGNDGQLGEYSLQPGAGLNVLITEEGILFKECPAGDNQRVISIAGEGTRTVLYEGDYFSGPFENEQGSFLITERNRIVEYSNSGDELAAWRINGFPAWSARSGGHIYYTGESGGLQTVDIVTGQLSEVSDCRGITYSRITTGPGGLLLAEMSPSGFEVLDSTGHVILTNLEGYFSSWTPDGNIICSYLELEKMEPISGKVCLINPRTGAERAVAEEGIPLYPLQLEDGKIIWTDAIDSITLGVNSPCLPDLSFHFTMDDPDAHFDVPYIHQRWDTPDWFNGSWSCGPTSCMMSVCYYMMLTPDSIWASYPSPGHWSLWGNYIPVQYTFLGFTYDVLGESPGGVMVPGAHGFICPNGSAVWNNMVDYLNLHEIFSAWAGTSWSTLTDQIDCDYPVVCSSSVLGYGHIILFNGYYANHTVVVNDPYGDANEPGWGNYYNGKDVLYDWPGYNNGHLQIGVNQLFYAQASVPAEPDTLVDDCSRGFHRFADCRFWHLTGSGFGGNAWWTYSTGAQPDTCVAEWHPVLPFEGIYDVSVFVPADYSSATAIYHLQTSSGTQEISLDQGLYAGQWAILGTFNLTFDSYLRLGDYTGTGGQYIAFDAALFSPSGTGIAAGGSPSRPRNIRLWPNPCGELVSIMLPFGNEGVSVEVFDTAGRLVEDISYNEFTDIVRIDVSSFSSGLYLARITLSDTGGSTTYSIYLTVCR